MKPMYMFVSLLFVVSLACSGSTALPNNAGGSEPQAQPTAIQPQPTKRPEATSTPAPTSTPAAQKFFTEEFDSVVEQWSYFVVDGFSSTITKAENPKMAVVIEDSLLTFDLKDEALWVYQLYQPYEYEDVRLDVRVNNRGVNNNNVSLICRYTETGWYEFNIANNGLYWILVAFVDSGGKVSYDLIYNGGSTAIKSGKETNEYTAICDGNELSLYINGKEARTVTDNKYSLSDGKVGVSVSSFDVLPVIVDFEWAQISEP